MKSLLLSLFVSFISFSASAKIRVITTLPDVAQVVAAIGKDRVTVDALLRGKEDAHFTEARPDYILKANRADLACSMGLELEVGWLPKVLSRSGNSKIQERATLCELGKSVQAIDVPTGVIDRSLGDVHAHGNPHFSLSPLQLANASDVVVKALTELDPSGAEVFKKNQDEFKKAMTDLHAKMKAQVKPVNVMEYHKEFSYFFQAYGLKSFGSLEEKPGTPPSAARIAQVAKMAKDNKVQVLLASPSAPHKVLEKFTELSGIPVKTVPSYVQSAGDNSSIEQLQETLVKSLL